MTQLDRIVIRAAVYGHLKFDGHVPNRFAKIGQVRLFRPVTDNRWAILFGHTNEDYGLTLGWFTHRAIEIARRYSTTPGD